MNLKSRRHPFFSAGLRWLILLILCALGLQVFFIARIAMMRFIDPASTAFQRSEVWGISHRHNDLKWSQRWVSVNKFPNHIQRAVIASEDDVFATHTGVQWDALERAWNKNAGLLAAQEGTASWPWPGNQQLAVAGGWCGAGDG